MKISENELAAMATKLRFATPTIFFFFFFFLNNIKVYHKTVYMKILPGTKQPLAPVILICSQLTILKNLQVFCEKRSGSM